MYLYLYKASTYLRVLREPLPLPHGKYFQKHSFDLDQVCLVSPAFGLSTAVETFQPGNWSASTPTEHNKFWPYGDFQIPTCPRLQTELSCGIMHLLHRLLVNIWLVIPRLLSVEGVEVEGRLELSSNPTKTSCCFLKQNSFDLSKESC